MTDHRARFLPLILIPALLIGLWWSWGTWPDVLIDFGRELYVPWRLAEGDVLYRDVAYFNGPLSPYVNSLWFRVFGASLRTLVFANIAVLAAAVLLIHRLTNAIAGPIAATLAGLTFLGLFAFGQYVGAGNYNWICPYSHEMTHGITLSLLAIYLAWRHTLDGRWWAVAGSGLALGMVFLTKPEVLLAGATGLVALYAANSFAERNFRESLRTGAIFIAAAVIPWLLSVATLAVSLPLRDALAGSLGGWVYMLDARITGNSYFRSLLGTDAVPANLSAMLTAAIFYAALVGGIGGLSLVFGRSRSSAWQGVIAVFLIVGLPLFLAREIVPWDEIARPWPIILLLLSATDGWTAWRARNDAAVCRPWILQFALLVFALALQFKVLLHVRLSHYGFGLAMPAAVLLVAAGWNTLPNLIQRIGGQPFVFRAGLLAVWLVTVLHYIEASNYFFAGKTVPVGSGGDRFLADGRGEYVEATVGYLQQQSKADETVAVMPEGVMINYLARRRAPVKYIVYIVPEMLMFGEQQMLAELEQHPPEWLVLVHRDDSEYGHRFFGRDYGQSISQWIQTNYQGAQLFGQHPLTGPYFGVLITRRADKTTKAAEAEK